MSIESFEVLTARTSIEAQIPLIGVSPASRLLHLHVWTAVTATEVPERPRGNPALIVLPGLRRALSVRVYESAEDVAVEDPATGVFGTGDDFPSAVQDFQQALQDHLAVLASEEALAPPLQHQLDTLRSYFTAS
jgi:hypothetical protein